MRDDFSFDDRGLDTWSPSATDCSSAMEPESTPLSAMIRPKPADLHSTTRRSGPELGLDAQASSGAMWL